VFPWVLEFLYEIAVLRSLCSKLRWLQLVKEENISDVSEQRVDMICETASAFNA